MFASKEFSAEGTGLPYRVQVPNGAGPWPLVLFLHGVGERGTDNQSQLRVGMADLPAWCRDAAHPAILVAPQCPDDQKWTHVNSDWTGVERRESPPAAQGSAIALVRELAATMPVDPRRIYLTGLSMGGFGVWDILWREPALFAAALPICGGGLVEEASTMSELPIWTFHGTKDPLVPVHQSRRMVEALRAKGSDIRYTEYPEGEHNVWDETYRNPEVLEWLFAQSR